ncbi:hypothetical protein [Metapseudomonas otitidis]|uniref:hypothetical protein n=1 Tax=Metapseudomonas otitidis TaxID=319939 RepID=UPI0013F61CD4|nr:hypothetical protein [Pseudomonas otitidis]
MDHLDPTHDVVVEHFQILSRNPLLRVLLSADLLDTVTLVDRASLFANAPPERQTHDVGNDRCELLGITSRTEMRG